MVKLPLFHKLVVVHYRFIYKLAENVPIIKRKNDMIKRKNTGNVLKS